MAKAKEAKPNPTDVAAKLAAALSGATKEASSAASTNVPAKKIAGGKATWKGVIELPDGNGGVLAKFAVKSCKAIDDEKFERHMYHSAECKNPVKREDMACSGCGAKGLNQYNTVKGVVVNGEVILVSDEELAAMVPQNEKTMRITEYVDGSNIDPIYFESTEFLYPEDEKKGAAQLTFAALGQMLRLDGTVAKGVRVKRGKEQYFVVRPFGNNGLTINLLRAEYEVRDASSLWASTDVPSEVVDMMRTVGEASKKEEFTPANRDQFLVNCDKLVAEKVSGIRTECPTPEPEQKGTDDLLEKLKAAMAASAAAKAAAAGK